MLLVFLLLFSGTIAFENENCDSIIKLKKREVRQLLSPNHPDKEPAGSTCRWTVVADTNRRIVFVCPFHHTLHETHTPEDVQPCNGQITVSPEGDEETRHCQNRGFSRIGVSNRMVISYENQLNEAVDNFTCYLYAELKSRWDLRESHTPDVTDPDYLDYGGFDYNITLGRNDVRALISPSDLEDENGRSNSRWTVHAKWSRITLACPFTDKPPEPLTTQVVPCHGQFTVLTEDESKTFHCSQKAFSHSTSSGWMVVIYQNPKGRPADNFACNVYSEENNRPPVSDSSSSPYKNCDYILNLTSLEVGVMKSPNYPDMTPELSRCRYTVIAPERSQILIKCSEPLMSENCHNSFTLVTAGRIDSKNCIDEHFSRLTSQNWTIITYYNSLSYSVVPFMCQAYLINEPLDDCDDCTETEVFTNQNCDHVILLHAGEVRQLLSPNHPNDEPGDTTCRWTVVAPPETRVVLACPNPNESGTDISEVLPCNGIITVSTEDRNETVHCSDRTFSRTSVNNRMVFVYENESSHPVKPFKCKLYAEEKLPVDNQHLTVHWVATYDKCDESIRLSMNEKRQWQSPNYPKNEPGQSACRWVVIAPPESRILLSCPFHKKQSPCKGYLTVSTEGQTNSTYCQDTPFLRASINNWMVITYENVSPDPSESFACYLYAELELPSNECANCTGTAVSPYTECDNIIDLKYHDMEKLKSHNYPEGDRPGSSCRWTVVAPPDSRILLHCPYNNEKQEISCNSHFTVLTAGSEKRYCRNETFFQYSINNWMIVTYKNPSFDTVSPFTCYTYVEKKLPTNDCGPTCPALETLDYRRCDKAIYLNETGKIKTLLSPDYPNDIPQGLPCRWTVHSPKFSFISMSCPHLADDDTKLDDTCRGYFTVYQGGAYTEPLIHCRHTPFAMRSAGDEMIITYGNQYGLTKKPFMCWVTAILETCHQTFQFPRLPYNEHYGLEIPYWESAAPPWSSCYWSIISPQETQVYLVCNYNLPMMTGNLMISNTGDDEFSDLTLRSLETSFTEISVGNKMSVQYNISNTPTRYNSLGCWIFVERSPPLGEECNCGNKFNKMLTNIPSSYRRIFGGKETLPNEYPMMAALCEDRQLFCGATIITDRYALTAAHCLHYADKKGFKPDLLVGAHDRSQANSGTYLEVDFMVWHQLFKDDGTLTYDIGIVGVSTPMRFNHLVGPVCLPFYNRRKSFYREPTISLGWGVTREKTTFLDYFYYLTSDILLKIEGHVEHDFTCERRDRYHVNDQHMCIKHNNATICKGDSGGPVLWKDPQTGLLKLIGIHIGAKKCGDTNENRMKTKETEVVHFLDWIEEMLPNVTFCKAE